MACSHISSSTKVWLPRLDNHIVVPHPYRKNCGTVKNISSDRAKEIGYYLDILSEIKKYLEKGRGKLTQVQMRMIVKELQKTGRFEDTYGIKSSAQKSAFISAAMRYTNLSLGTIDSFL